MSDPVDLNAERERREGPDPEFVTKDGFGRPLYLFAMSYDMGGSEWSAHVWAYSREDADARVAAMRGSLRCDGQVYQRVLA